jgi:hypothetical protein
MQPPGLVEKNGMAESLLRKLVRKVSENGPMLLKRKIIEDDE